MLLIWEESDNVILTKKSWPFNPRHLIHGMPWMYETGIFAYGRAVLAVNVM